MTDQERREQDDPRLADPEEYFRANYGEARVIYGRFPEMTIREYQDAELEARTKEEIAKAPKSKRANMYISLLREAGVLDPRDDVTYQEES
jgi:hypothetical protein